MREPRITNFQQRLKETGHLAEESGSKPPSRPYNRSLPTTRSSPASCQNFSAASTPAWKPCPPHLPKTSGKKSATSLTSSRGREGVTAFRRYPRQPRSWNSRLARGCVRRPRPHWQESRRRAGRRCAAGRPVGQPRMCIEGRVLAGREPVLPVAQRRGIEMHDALPQAWDNVAMQDRIEVPAPENDIPALRQAGHGFRRLYCET